jgi:hypothetical protein
MRKSLLFILCIIFILPLAISGQTNSFKIKGVEVGTWYSTAIRKLGKPISDKTGGNYPCDDGKMKTVRYNGLVLKFVESYPGKNFFVASMEITSSRWTVSGIRIGATLKDVQAKFSGEVRNEDGSEIYGGFIKDGYLNFFFKNGRLVRITSEENLC